MTAPCRVLLADDTPEIRMLVRMALELDGGFEVVGEAADGFEALQLSDQHRPDAVIIDIAMPVMDGLEAIPVLKKSNPMGKILVLSGFDAAQMKNEAMEAGADAYLEKGESAQKIIQLLQGFFPGSSVANGHTAGATPPHLQVIATDVEVDGSDTLSSLAHELMTPVTVIQGFAETLASRADTLDPATVRTWADTIARNARNAAAIIRSFRDTAKLESGDTSLDLHAIELLHLVEETVADLSGITQGRDVVIPSGEQVELVADQVKVRQILANLISNAVKFSPAETPIEISILAGRFYAEVCVRDHGRGVAPDQHEELFKKFARLDAPEPGSGLGLYICRRLARAHGGDVVYKQADGGGASFCLRLPLPLVSDAPTPGA